MVYCICSYSTALPLERNNMKQLALPYQPTVPPKKLQRVRLDNIAIVPASVFNNKAQRSSYEALSRRLPKGSVLILRPTEAKLGKILESAASFFKDHGHLVTTLPVGRSAA